MGAAWMSAAGGAAWASEESHPCAAIVDDANRLACYDKAFGAPDSPANEAARREERSNYNFSAVVAGLERRGDRFVVTLDNGQLWSQVETNTRIDLRVGNTVTIRRGALGSYLMSDGEGLATRVKRLR